MSDHLLNDFDNDHVELIECRGFIADDLACALDEAHVISKATQCRQFLFSLSLNPPMDHICTAKDFLKAADRAESKLGCLAPTFRVGIRPKLAISLMDLLDR